MLYLACACERAASNAIRRLTQLRIQVWFTAIGMAKQESGIISDSFQLYANWVRCAHSALIHSRHETSKWEKQTKICLPFSRNEKKSRKYQKNGWNMHRNYKKSSSSSVPRVFVEFTVGWKERECANRNIFLSREGGNRGQIFAHFPSHAQIIMRKQRELRTRQPNLHKSVIRAFGEAICFVNYSWIAYIFD